jgi:FtsP/CotA-like multicopper oxidase with cupredoxin domain
LSIHAVLETGFLLVAYGVVARSASPAAAPRRSPPILESFRDPLPIPQIKRPVTGYTNQETGVPIDFYELHVREFGRRFYPNLSNGTAIGYDGAFPGPTFRVERGRETVVRVVNQASRTVNLHLHGSYSEQIRWHATNSANGVQHDLVSSTEMRVITSSPDREFKRGMGGPKMGSSRGNTRTTTIRTK